MSLYTGARPKTRSILSNKIINETENICIDKTVPVISNIAAPINSSTPRTSLSPKRRLLNDLAVDRPTRSNKNYVPLARFSDPETLFKKNKTPKSLTAKFIDFFSPSQKKSIPERTFSPIEKPIFEPVTFPEDIQIENLVCSTAKSPVLTNQPSTSAVENSVRPTHLIDTVINIPDEVLIADGNLEPQERVVENNNTFIQNNAEIFVANDRSSAEITDSFFTVLNRVADLLNNPRPAKPSSLPIPTEQESSTLEAVNHPVSFTPYIDFQNVLNQLGEQNIVSNGAEDSITDNLDILLEEERNFFHGFQHSDDQLNVTIDPRPMQLSCESGTVEATPKLQNTNQIDQIAHSSHQGGADFNGYSNNPGGDQESLQVAIQPIFTLSDQIPNFPISSANYLANESIVREANDVERVDSPFICTCDRCSGRINFDNQIHCGNGRVSKNFEDISGEARNKRSCLEQEKPRDSLIISANSRPAIYPELQPSLSDQRILYTVPPINERDRHRPLLNPSTTIRGETAAPSGANNCTPRVHFSSERNYHATGVHHSGRTANQPNNKEYLSDKIYGGNRPAEQPKRYYPQVNIAAEKQNQFHIDRPMLHAARHVSVPIITVDAQNKDKRGGATRQSEGDRQQHRRGREEESRGGAENRNESETRKDRKKRDEREERRNKERNMAGTHTPADYRPTGRSTSRDRSDRDGRRRDYKNEASGWSTTRGRSRKPRSSDTSESDDYEFYDEYLPSGDPTKSFKPAGNDYHISPVKRPAQKKEDYSQKINAFSDSNKGRGAITMLNHIQNYTGGQAVRFDRWIKLFDNVVAMSNWNNSDIISMLSTKMTGEAYDFLQNILESDTQDYIKIKALFQENFHGDEDADFYRDKFDEIQRKPKENILNYAFRLKTIYQRAYPSNKLETQEELASQLQFLRQKFLQGLESELQHIVRYKKVSTFEELVAVTQKYAKRVQLEQNDKDKKLFVNAVTNTQTDSLLIQAIEKQNESINAIATSLKFGNKPTETTTYQKPSTNMDFHQQMDRLTESMLSLGGLLQSNIQNDIIRNQQKNVQANNRNQPRQTNFPYPSQDSNNFKSRPSNKFQQPATQAVQQPPTISAGQNGQPFQNPNFTPPNFLPRLPAQYPPQSFQQNQQNPQATQHPQVHTQQISQPFQQPLFFQQPPQVNFQQQGQIYRPQQQTGMKCTNCGLTNHNIETCFRIQRQALDTNVCFYCKKPGHRSNVCIHRPNIIQPAQISSNQGNA